MDRPSESAMPEVFAVSVSPTWAVPVMVGAPVAAEFSCENSWLDGPGITNSTPADSIPPRAVQMAPRVVQSVVAGRVTVTLGLPDGRTLISHRLFLCRSSLRALVTSPPVTVKAWSRRVR